MKNKMQVRFSVTILLIFSTLFAISQPISNPYQNPYGNTQTGGTTTDTKTKKDFKTDEKLDSKIDDNTATDKQKPANEDEFNNGNKNIDAKDLKDENAENANKEDKNYTSTNDELNKKKKETGVINNYTGPNIYGMNFFANNDFTFSDKNSLAPPTSYRIGPGDEIIVNIWGSSEAQQTYTVGKDGSIYPKFVGKIYVQGLTFESAKNIIESKFRKIVANGSSIDVQMGRVRTIKVNLKGEVKRPGTFTVSAFNTAINVLSAAGGVSALGDLRNIRVMRNGNLLYAIDLYQFMKGQGENEDLYLQDNDDIVVDMYDRLVKAEGNFKRPMFYELKQDENLSSLLELTGGPTFDARFSNITITSVANESAKLLTINYKDLSSLGRDVKLMDGDIVSLSKINLGISNSASIDGAVNYPQAYQIEEGERLLDMINKAGGLKNDAYVTRAYIYRGDSLSENTRVIKIDLSDLTKDDYEKNIEIFPGDYIKIISKSNFTNKYTISISGNVKKPGTFEYQKGLKLKDLLIMTGGLTLDAESGRIEIASYIDSINNYEQFTKNKMYIRTYKINKNLALDDSSENILLQPNDRVYVRRKIESIKPEKVIIAGEVNYPGEYALVNKEEKISDIIKRAGGLKSTASLKGARFSRAGIGYIIVNFDEILTKRTSKDNFFIIDGDIISIPAVSEIVNINGQVLYPLNIKFDPSHKVVKYYINSAGGFNDNPWKDRINIKYQSGKIRTTKHIFFFRKYPKMETGCLLTIPKKPKRDKTNKFNFSEVSGFTSSLLSTVATLITTFVLIKTISK